MAFMDFMNSGIGGNTPINQNTTMAGTAGQPIGPTYGDLTSGLIQYGSSPGSSGPRLATSANTAMNQVKPMPLDPNAPPQQLEASGQGKGNDSMGQIVSMLLKMFGGV